AASKPKPSLTQRRVCGGVKGVLPEYDTAAAEGGQESFASSLRFLASNNATTDDDDDDDDASMFRLLIRRFPSRRPRFGSPAAAHDEEQIDKGEATEFCAGMPDCVN
ncbi:hypothetical protein K0M31_001635, partial [Melipona bicolor]